jgi:uncharacterized protein
MKRQDYWIDIINLKNGTYEYDFNINSEFFDFFDESLLEKGKIAVTLKLEKNERLIRAIFNLEGHLELVCDRSLKAFNYPISEQQVHLYKFSSDSSEDTEDITHINLNTDSLDLGHLIYEYITLTIPMRKIHPDYLGTDDEEGFYYKTGVEEKENTNEESIDPRWEALKKLNK